MLCFPRCLFNVCSFCGPRSITSHGRTGLELKASRNCHTLITCTMSAQLKPLICLQQKQMLGTLLHDCRCATTQFDTLHWHCSHIYHDLEKPTTLLPQRSAYSSGVALLWPRLAPPWRTAAPCPSTALVKHRVRRNRVAMFRLKEAHSLYHSYTWQPYPDVKNIIVLHSMKGLGVGLSVISNSFCLLLSMTEKESSQTSHSWLIFRNCIHRSWEWQDVRFRGSGGVDVRLRICNVGGGCRCGEFAPWPTGIIRQRCLRLIRLN